MKGEISIPGVVMALGGGLLAGLAIHNYMETNDIELIGIIEIITGLLLFLWGAAILLGHKRAARKLGFRVAKVSAATVLLLLIIFGLIGYTYWKGHLSIPKVPGVSEEEKVTEQIPLQLPIKLIVRNKLTGTSLNISTLELYNTKGYVVETLTVSSGATTTSGAYKSGERFYVKISDGSTFYFIQIALPLYDAEVAKIKPPDFHVIGLDAVDVPSTITLKVIDSTGNQVSSVNLITPSPFTVLVTNSEPDTALPDPFYNPTMKSWYYNYLVIEVTGSGSVLPRVSGASTLFQTNGKAVYGIKLGSLACVTDPRTGSATPKTASYGITIDPTGVPSGSYTVKITAYTDLDLNYVKNYGVVNTDAVALGSTTLTVNV